MPTVELDIRQLADEGGTAPLAPITVTDAVLDENGDTLTDILDEIKSDLENIQFIAMEVAAPSSTSISGSATSPVSFSVSRSGWSPLGIVGFDIQSPWLVPINMKIGAGEIATIWVKNTSTSAVATTPSVIVLYKKA